MRGWRNGGGRGCVGAVGDVHRIQTANGDRHGAVKCVRAGKNADHVAPSRIGYRANHHRPPASRSPLDRRRPSRAPAGGALNAEAQAHTDRHVDHALIEINHLKRQIAQARASTLGHPPGHFLVWFDGIDAKTTFGVANEVPVEVIPVRLGNP